MPLPPRSGPFNAILSAVAATDVVTGPLGLDMRPTTVTIEVRVYEQGFQSAHGSYSLQGTPLVLTPPPRVRHVTTKEIADSGGRYDRDDVKVEPIRPQFTAIDGTIGGYTRDQIDPARTAPQNPYTHQGTRVVYVLASEYDTESGISGEYSLLEFRHDRPYRMQLVLRRAKTTP